MTALVRKRYRAPDMLAYAEIARVSLRRVDVLIRVLASIVTSGDRRVRGMGIPKDFRALGQLALGWHGQRQPVLGAESADVVQAVRSRAL